MAPPGLLELGIRHTVNPDANSRTTSLKGPSPENPGAPGVIIRCHDRNRMPVMLFDAGAQGLSLLEGRVHLRTGFAKIYMGGGIGAVGPFDKDAGNGR